MSTMINPPRKISKRHELRSDTVVTFYARAWGYFEQNKTLAYAAAAAVVLVILGVIAFVFYQSQRADQAQRLLGQVVGVYESGEYRAALDGTETATGLIEIADNYGGTSAGNLARFYAANALYNLGEYDDALRYFRAFKKSKDFLGTSALAGEAAVHENRGEFERAGDLYRRASEYFENELTSPQYLVSAGRAYEEAGAFDKARRAYEAIRDRHPESSQAGAVDVYLARVEARK
jgi:tetratricopeptide (TPR) repeat protein